MLTAASVMCVSQYAHAAQYCKTTTLRLYYIRLSMNHRQKHYHYTTIITRTNVLEALHQNFT